MLGPDRKSPKIAEVIAPGGKHGSSRVRSQSSPKTLGIPSTREVSLVRRLPVLGQMRGWFGVLTDVRGRVGS